MGTMQFHSVDHYVLQIIFQAGEYFLFLLWYNNSAMREEKPRVILLSRPLKF